MSLRQRDMSYDTVSQVSGPEVVEQLHAEVAEWRCRAEVAEAQAAERERVIEAQWMALKMLEAAPVEPSTHVSERPAGGAGGPGLLARLLRF